MYATKIENNAVKVFDKHTGSLKGSLWSFTCAPTLRGCLGEDAALDQLLAALDVELLQELDARLAAIPVE